MRKKLLKNFRITCLRISRGVLIDLPWIINSSLRHLDYRAFHLWAAPRGSSTGDERQIPQGTGLLCALIVSIVYGMTPDALCGVTTAASARAVLFVSGVMYLILVFILALKVILFVKDRIGSRFARRPTQTLRKGALQFSTWPLFALLFAGVLLCVIPLFDAYTDGTTCNGSSFNISSLVQLLFAVALCVVSFFLLRKHPAKARPIFLASLTAAIIFSLLFWSSGNSEANHQPFTTVLSLVVIPFVVVASGTPWLAWRLFRGYRAADDLKFHESLRETELFQIRTEPRLNCARLGFAMLAPIFHHLIFLLFWPSLAAIIAPIGRVSQFYWVAFVLAFFFAFQSSITDRWNQTLLLVRRLLMTGFPLMLSLVVIVLGILRLCNVQYVSIILDAAPFGALTMGIGSLYVLFWLFELAINRPLMVQLLGLFVNPKQRADFLKTRGTRIQYKLKHGHKLTNVDEKRRYLQLHGTGRFLVTGRQATDPDRPAWHSYDRPKLFEHVLSVGTEGSKRQIAWADLRRRIRTYFFLTNAAVVVLLGVGAFIQYKFEWPLKRTPLIVVSQQDLDGRGPFVLKDRLLEKNEKNRPAILFAASGGGTRAALYSASVLYGLTLHGVGDDIVLISGVSGGSASVAYFGANQQQLIEGSPEQLGENWRTFIDRITYPYIEDVIEGGAEAHSVLNLSHLLEKSMDRNLGIGSGKKLAEIEDVGLVFNSVVAGHPAKDAFLSQELLRDDIGEQYVVARGGRMIFTNVDHVPGLPGDGVYGENSFSDATRFHMMVVRAPDVRVTQAVTTTANFPAVFPNSDVWVTENARATEKSSKTEVAKYSISDGGALDNRGVLSLLYMLRGALKDMDPKQVPEIHIVIADASAMSFDYSRDRGLAAAFSASSKLQLADGLIRTLMADICREISGGEDTSVWTDSRTGCETKIQLHTLNMPTVFRSRGGIGTHWMMPAVAQLKDPRSPTKKGEKADVRCNDLIDTIMALHAGPTSYCGTEISGNKEVRKLRSWICGDVNDENNKPDPHGENWQDTVQKLSAYEDRLSIEEDEDYSWLHCSRS
jgi:hypothetical protein